MRYVELLKLEYEYIPGIKTDQADCEKKSYIWKVKSNLS